MKGERPTQHRVAPLRSTRRRWTLFAVPLLLLVGVLIAGLLDGGRAAAGVPALLATAVTWRTHGRRAALIIGLLAGLGSGIGLALAGRQPLPTVGLIVGGTLLLTLLLGHRPVDTPSPTADDPFLPARPLLSEPALVTQAALRLAAAVPTHHIALLRYDHGQFRLAATLSGGAGALPESRNQPLDLARWPQTETVVLRRQRTLLRSVSHYATPEVEKEALRSLGLETLLEIPLLQEETVLGTMRLGRSAGQPPFDQQELATLTALGRHLSTALSAARRDSAARARAALLNALNRLTERLSASESLAEVYDAARREIFPLLEASHLSLALLEDDGQLTWTYGYGYGRPLDMSGVPRQRVGSGLAGLVAQGQPLRLGGRDVARAAARSGIKTELPPGAWLGVPLIAARRTIGVLICENRDDGEALQAREQEILVALAAPLAATINHLRQLARAEAGLAAQARQSLLLQTAAAISAAGSEILDAEELLARVAGLVEERFGFYFVGLLLTEPAGGRLLLAAAAGAGAAAVAPGPVEPEAAPTVVRAISLGELQQMDADAAAAVPFSFSLPATRAELAIPLRARGTIIGALNLQSSTAAGFDPESITALQTVADQLATAIDNAHLFSRVQQSLVHTNNLFLASRQVIQAETPDDVYGLLVEFVGASGQADMALLIVTDPRAPTHFLYPAIWSRAEALRQDPQPAIGSPHPFAELLPDLAPRTIRPAEEGDQLAAATRAFMAANDLQTAALVPIHRETVWLGSLALLRAADHPFAAEDLQPFLTLCNQAAAVLSTQQLLGETSTLYRASRALSQVITREDALELIVRELTRYTGADQCRVVIYDYRRGHGRVELEYAPSGGAEKVQFGMTGDPVFERLRDERHPQIIRDDGGEDLLAAAYLRPFGAGSSLIIPAFSQQELIGFIALEAFNPDREYAPTEINFARTLVDQLSTQIENLALFDEALTRAQEMITLNQIGALISSTLDIDDLAQVIYEQVGRLMDNSIFLLAEYVPETRTFRPLLATRYGERFTALPCRLEAEEALYQLLHDDRPVTDDLQAVVGRQAGLSGLYVSGWMPESALWVTMRREGAPSGLISVQSYRPLAYEESHLQLLRTITNQAGLALANARLFQQTEEALTEQRTLFDITQAATASPDPGSRLQQVAAALSDTFAGASVTILMVDAASGGLARLAGDGRVSDDADGASLHSGILREAVLRSRPVLVADLRSLTGYDAGEDALSQLVVPINFGRRTVGLVNLTSATTHAFSESDLRLVQTLGPSIAATIESNRLFQEIQEANEQLRELDRLKMQFLANMSHELRTPLNSIIGFSRVILKGIDGPVNQQQQEDLTAIYNSGQHLLNIINDILDVARIEAGKLALVYEEVDLHRLARRAIETVRGLVRAAEIDLITDLPADLPTIEADPVRLRQILLNLLSNAAKFTSAGEIRLRMEHRPVAGGTRAVDQVAMIVSDTGTGIPAEEFDRIFTAFERIDRSAIRAEEGTGLGLPITKRLVELHHGTIQVASEPGQGTTFTILLPVYQPPAETAEQEPASVAARAQIPDLEDDPV